MADPKPKEKLTDLLAERRDGDLDFHTNTHYPTAELLRLQELDSIMGSEHGLGLPFFAYSAENRAAEMWSFKMVSREQAVEALKMYDNPNPGIILNQDRTFSNPEPQAPIKKKSWFSFGRKADEQH